jgi:hypothetical protein
MSCGEIDSFYYFSIDFVDFQRRYIQGFSKVVFPTHPKKEKRWVHLTPPAEGGLILPL